MSDEPNQNPTPDLAGYPDVNALAQGYRESGNQAKKWRDEALQWKAKAEAFASVNPRPDIPQRQSGNPYDQLQSEYGLPGNLLREAITTELGQALAPIARGFEARNQLLSQYTDYTKYEADVASFVNSDPAMNQTYQRMFSADPVGAMEYAFLKYGEVKRKEVGPKGNEPERQAAIAQAQIPTQRSAEVRNGTSSDQDERARAWEHFQKTGNPTAFAKARLKQVIPDSFLMQ